MALPRVKRKKQPGDGGSKGEGRDRELSPTMRSLPTWWIEVSFENVCAHGQIHKEGCKPRLRPSSGGSLIFRTKFHPIPNRRRYPRGPSPPLARSAFPPFLPSPPPTTMCVRVPCQSSDPRTNILALFEERELLGAVGVPATERSAIDRGRPRSCPLVVNTAGLLLIVT